MPSMATARVLLLSYCMICLVFRDSRTGTPENLSKDPNLQNKSGVVVVLVQVAKDNHTKILLLIKQRNLI